MRHPGHELLKAVVDDPSNQKDVADCGRPLPRCSQECPASVEQKGLHALHCTAVAFSDNAAVPADAQTDRRHRDYGAVIKRVRADFVDVTVDINGRLPGKRREE
jgi:hypothetical protein